MGVERADWEITVRAVLEHTSFGAGGAFSGRRARGGRVMTREPTTQKTERDAPDCRPRAGLRECCAVECAC
jgi:hypothetical protein